MSFKYLDDGKVNPKLNLSNSFENNCSLSVYAGEARDLDVVAWGVTLPKKSKTTIAYQLGEDMSIGWIAPATGKAPEITKCAIIGGQQKNAR